MKSSAPKRRKNPTTATRASARVPAVASADQTRDGRARAGGRQHGDRENDHRSSGRLVSTTFLGRKRDERDQGLAIQGRAAGSAFESGSLRP